MKIDTAESDAGSKRELRRQDYGTETLFIADLGTDIGDATVDAVDGTAIVVTDADEQFEIELPAAASETSINNGVLTIEVSR